MKHLKLLFLTLTLLIIAPDIVAQTTDGDTIFYQVKEKKNKKSFGQTLFTPIKWIMKNWTAYDPKYSLPSFYNWAGQIQNSTSFEWLRLQSPDGTDVDMHSNVSNRIGPYFGYRWLFFGATIDLSTLGKKAKNKDEFTLSINSSLMNIDLIRRRTGGDFTVKRMITDFYGEPVDLTDFTSGDVMGEYIKNSLTGFNINMFTNFKKYSNPAAFSNGAVQLRSVGSPIIGFGYTNQKVENELTFLYSSLTAQAITESPGAVHAFDDYVKLEEKYEYTSDEYVNTVMQFLKDDLEGAISVGDTTSTLIAMPFMVNTIPTVTTINDWHLQLGYAYNLVFSRRLLLGMSVIVSPSLKHVKATNEGSMAYLGSERMASYFNAKYGTDLPGNFSKYRYNKTHFNFNLFARASLVYNFNRWRAGVMATFSNYFFKHENMKVSNGYGNINIYVGYCFGRKKEYRHNGKLRQDYIHAALTKSQIAEMRDTMPQGNIDRTVNLIDTGDKTNYKDDEFTIGVYGCDLVKGPDGRYGWYELEDGYVAPGEDSEGYIRPGAVYDLDENGTFNIKAGHSNSIRAGNWWKSQLQVNQTPNNWYPEMLHYALRGKLTLYVRGRIFGTKKPVKLTLDDFCINHGKETNSFFQVGIKSFKSYASYSIEGNTMINGRKCRIYIEQKRRGQTTNMYVARLYDSNKTWMAQIDGKRPISTISIPGTHDSGTSALPEEPAIIFRGGHTQNFSVPAQLEDGIRAFDIRLKKNLKYGHTIMCRDGFDSTMVAWEQFLKEHPSEFIVAMIGSDEGGKWGEELTANYAKLINKYKHLFVEDFSPATPLDSVRGKILVIRRQAECPFGKLLKFTDNSVFEYDGFHVEDVYKEHKTYKKIKIVEKHIREAYENDNPNKWYITFNSIAWSPRRHNPYSYAWGGKAKNIRKPMNKSLREIIELKDYNEFGIVFLDFYNDHGDNPQIVETIINSNMGRDDE